MQRLEFKVVWQEAEHVQGAELAATWAYFELLLGDRALTRVFDHRAKTVRDGVFVPAYPLAEWLVGNWWSLLNEVENPDKVDDIEFELRHSMVFAREGYALPAVQFVSSETRTRAIWESETLTRSGLEFLGPSGEDSIEKSQFRDACESFIDSVIRRLDSMGVEDTILQREWSSIQDADAEESAFCQAAAGIGWDPYALDDRERGLIHKIERMLSDDVLEQALAVLDPENIDTDLQAITTALETGRSTQLPLRQFRQLSPSILEAARDFRDFAPWQAGYAIARETRKKLGLDGKFLSTFAALGSAIDEDPIAIEAATTPINFGGAELVDGVITMTENDPPGFAFQATFESSRRYRFCRALVETLLRPGRDTLITRANSEQQSLSRAFAAEFLAPAEALRGLIATKFVGDDQMAKLASDFGVSQMVIQHQLKNHGIARTGRDRSRLR